MKRRRLYAGSLTVALVLINACGSGGSSDKSQDTNPVATATLAVTSNQLETHIKYLASDELGGRGPGTRGEELTLSYLTEQYSSLGLRPGNPDGTYVQAVPLEGLTVTNSPSLELKSNREGFELRYGDDFVGWTLRRQERVSVEEAEMLFVGYGIVAPEYDWDDYKDVDVVGKVIVMLVGDPPLPDTTLFGGHAMTYYGRWTYKYEIAAEKGAAGAIIIHKTEAAGYPWEVVTNSWSGEQFDIQRGENGVRRCAVEGWIRQSTAEQVFGHAGMELDDGYARALSADFEPVALGLTAAVSIETAFRTIRSYNVIALLEGNDPELKSEYILYTAHWDHLGKGHPADGDSIYNGARDNASGVAATLEIARAFVDNRDRLRRSILFLNTTAEESGLLGSYHYAENPLYPLEKTVALVNIDGLNIWGRTKDVVVVGYGFSELDDYLAKATESQNRYLRPDAEPQKGYYYRSDHFPFAKKGVPALDADSGVEFRSKPQGWGTNVRRSYTSERYHKPSDEFDGSWDLSGAIEDLEAFFRVGMMVATTDRMPRWSDGSEFKLIREQSLRGTP
ncbi:MAG: M28 family metallopeptidase [Candidatus Krumholzibacteria bacterium]|nr:M28 family metallopeptidase [Candidatus Krumholzibacteria bacterium]